MDNTILEPIKNYENELKGKFSKNTADYFEALVKKSNVDESANAKTVAAYNKTMANLAMATKHTRTMKALKYLSIALTVILFICFVVFVYLAASKNESVPIAASWAIGIVCLVVAIVLIVLLATVIRKALKSAIEHQNALQDKADKQKAMAFKQAAPLNNLFDWKILSDIVNQTNSAIKIDQQFDAAKYDYFNGKYGFQANDDPNRSTCVVQSGSLFDSPFLIVTDLVHTTVDHTYTGTLEISWTENVTNSKGESETVTRTQTLFASIVKPMPWYNSETVLIYGNELTPNLCFSREPSGVEKDDSEKSVQKLIKHRAKEIDKMSKAAIKGKLGNDNFTAMGNSEFDTLFGAVNRNNEVDFRLLFTPLAQKNELDLIKDKTYYGDDFYFEKNKQLIFIESEHSQVFNYDANPELFVHYDIAESRKRFNEYYNEYFQNLFFDLAPILAIPLYQTEKPTPYTYRDDCPFNYTSYEEESLANYIGADFFKDPISTTKTILKTSLISKEKGYDRVSVKAHSFNGIERVALIPVRGGDGRIHDVPVPWIDYVPTLNELEIVVKNMACSRSDFAGKNSSDDFKKYFAERAVMNSLAFKRGFFGFIPSESSSINGDELKKVFDLK